RVIGEMKSCLREVAGDEEETIEAVESTREQSYSVVVR
ncbi:hypothetical protein A2U01_0046012, partial [Trifolium medium]|nr:hypothetical protein [Trifolium medium]